MRKLIVAIGVLAASVTAGCSDGTMTGPRRDTGPGGGIDAGPGATSCATASDCLVGQRCSAATSTCIPMDECRGPADCAAGETCGAGSLHCQPAGMCGADGDCPTGQVCDEATSTCMIGGMCGTSEFAIARLAPNVMILLDRSGSMDGSIDGSTRWNVAKVAIEAITTRFDAEIRFGLATYSSCLPGGCSAGHVVVPIADMNATRINDFLRPLRDRGSARGTAPDYLCDSGDPETSTGRSLAYLVGEPTLQDTSRANVVLLITDGGESGSCTPPDGEAGATMLYGQPVPVRTFAVGFSADTNPDQLRAIAVAGMTGDFFQADSRASLEAAMADIAAAVASCDYHVDVPPPDPSMLYVYFNDDPAGVPTGAEGWSYDPATQTLTFGGAACTAIQAGTVLDIDVVYGCPGPILE